MARTPLAARLEARIRAEGPLPFHDFMQAALYDPEHGYYAKGPRIGGEGADFSTSVAFPEFRLAIARLVERAREALGASTFRVVELGAGTGELARAVIEQVPGVEYLTVDASAGLRARQAEVPGVRTVASTRELDPAPGLVLGNEVLDALPVRRVVGAGDGSLLEVVVDAPPAGGFRERLAPLRDPSIEARLRAEGVWPHRGQVFDVAPALEAFVADAARLADPGYLVLIDYGDPAERLYAPDRLNGTLAAYKSHGKFHDPYDDVGERDITADVDFTAVGRAAEAAGLEPFLFASQQRVLEALGADPGDTSVRATALGSAFWVLGARRGVASDLGLVR